MKLDDLDGYYPSIVGLLFGLGLFLFPAWTEASYGVNLTSVVNISPDCWVVPFLVMQYCCALARSTPPSEARPCNCG